MFLAGCMARYVVLVLVDSVDMAGSSRSPEGRMLDSESSSTAMHCWKHLVATTGSRHAAREPACCTEPRNATLPYTLQQAL